MIEVRTLALRALGALYLDALAQVGARVVIALDAGARRLDPPTPGDPRP